jgi:hypothetical protein
VTVNCVASLCRCAYCLTATLFANCLFIVVIGYRLNYEHEQNNVKCEMWRWVMALVNAEAAMAN